MDVEVAVEGAPPGVAVGARSPRCGRFLHGGRRLGNPRLFAGVEVAGEALEPGRARGGERKAAVRARVSEVGSASHVLRSAAPARAPAGRKGRAAGSARTD